VEVERARALGKTAPLWSALIEAADRLSHQISTHVSATAGNAYGQNEALALAAVEHLLEARGLISETYDPAKFAQTSERLGKTYKLIARLSSLDDIGIDDVSRLYQPDAGHLSDRTTGFLRSAIEHYKDSLWAHGEYSYKRTREGLINEIAEEYVQLREWDEAITHFEKALEIGRSTQFDVTVWRDEFADLIRWFQRLTECAAYSYIRAGRCIEGLAYADNSKARLLIKFLGLNTFEAPPEERAKIEALRKEQKQIEASLVAPLVINRRQQVERVVAIREELSALAGKLAVPDARSVIDRLNQLLDDDTLLIAPILSSLGGETVFAYRHSEQVEVRHVRSKDAHFFNSEIIEGRQSWMQRYGQYKERQKKSGSELTEAIYRSSKALNDMFLGVLLEELSRLRLPAKSKLLVVPHGALARLPLAAARIPEGKHLLDQFELVFLPSIQIGVRASQLRPADACSPLAIANINGSPDAPDGHPRFNRAECALLGNAAPGRVRYLARRDVEDDISATLDALAESRIWHFSSHGRFEELAPERSFIQISPDSKITLGQLHAAGQQPRPDLVVLSSCESGLFDTDDLPNEFIGWPTAFLEIGAKGVVATQWPVASLPTTFLMARLYDAIWSSDGNTVPQALRSAQLWLRDVMASDLPPLVKGWVDDQRLNSAEAEELLEGLKFSGSAKDGRAFPEPIYWAGFAYFGDPGLRLKR
tara:strand:- start:6491 stop:8611 length:2121 start_codon:yes stop_codon:yes gene_type:complete